MADKKTLKDEAPPIHEAGQFAALCVDVIDLGYNVEQYQNQPPELKDKLALVFRTEGLDEKGKPRYTTQEFTASIGKKSNLRKFLEAWRGKAYTDDEARKQGIPLDKMEGVPALITVAHKVSGKGNEYAHILSIAPLPKQMRESAPTSEGYERPEFWTKKKAEYAEAVAKFNAGHAKPDVGEYPETLDDEDSDSSLPF